MRTTWSTKVDDWRCDGRNNMANNLLVAGAMLGASISLSRFVALQPAGVSRVGLTVCAGSWGTRSVTADRNERYSRLMRYGCLGLNGQCRKSAIVSESKQLLPFQVILRYSATDEVIDIVMRAPALRSKDTATGTNAEQLLE